MCNVLCTEEEHYVVGCFNGTLSAARYKMLGLVVRGDNHIPNPIHQWDPEALYRVVHIEEAHEAERPPQCSHPVCKTYLAVYRKL